MPQEQRKEIIEAISGVDYVFVTNHSVDCEDMSVCDALREIHPTVFANGGDRFADNIPEAILCKAPAGLPGMVAIKNFTP